MSQSAWNPGGGAPPGPPGYGQPQQGYGPPPAAYGQPPPQQGYAGPPAQASPIQSAAASPAASKGFLMGLIDFSFTNFIATRVLKVLYGIWLVALGLGMILGVFGAINTMFFGYRTHILEGLVQLVLLPFAGALWLVLGRVYFELLIVIFRIAENLTEMNRKMKDS